MNTPVRIIRAIKARSVSYEDEQLFIRKIVINDYRKRAGSEWDDELLKIKRGRPFRNSNVNNVNSFERKDRINFLL